MSRLLPSLASIVVAIGLASCAHNPATGGSNVVMGTMSGEKESGRKAYEQIIRFYGLYDDQAVQDYVNEVGQRVARQSDMPDAEFKFVVLDDETINAFTTGCCYVYVNRGLLTYLSTEAELASVLGHEVGHVTARHPARRQTQNVLAGVLATGAAIATGSGAVAQLANLGAGAWLQGYGRENEMEADRLGMVYATKAEYRPEAMGEVFRVFKDQERFELDRARVENREPRIYHGVFSSHPAPDDRAVQAAKGSAKIKDTPAGGWKDNREAYLRTIDGMPYGSSRAQGIVRDNRFYHAGMGITMAFPRGWTVDNLRDRLSAYPVNKDSITQVLVEPRPDKQAPREFLLSKLKGASIAQGEAVNTNGMEGYSVVTRSGSPLDGGRGPVRWTVLYRDQSAFLFAGASKASVNSIPEADGLFNSVMGTLRGLKPSEFPLAEPYRIKIVPYAGDMKLDDYAKNVPVVRYQREELLLINGLYPKGVPEPGKLIKVVE